MIHLVQPQVNFTSGRHVWDISSDWKGIILNIKLFEGGALYPEWAFLVCIINFWVAEYLLYVIRKSILIKFVCVVNSFLKVHLLWNISAHRFHKVFELFLLIKRLRKLSSAILFPPSCSLQQDDNIWYMRLVKESLYLLWGSIFIIGCHITKSHQIELFWITSELVQLFERLVKPKILLIHHVFFLLGHRLLFQVDANRADKPVLPDQHKWNYAPTSLWDHQG